MCKRRPANDFDIVQRVANCNVTAMQGARRFVSRLPSRVSTDLDQSLIQKSRNPLPMTPYLYSPAVEVVGPGSARRFISDFCIIREPLCVKFLVE